MAHFEDFSEPSNVKVDHFHLIFAANLFFLILFYFFVCL